MADMLQDMNTTSSDEAKQHRKGFKAFRVVPHSEYYVSMQNPMFWHRLDELYGVIEAYRTNWNQANWAGCCYTFERTKAMGSLGHLPECTISIKQLIHNEGLHELEAFRRFMLKTLPRKDGDLILMPQANMRHWEVKQEEPSQSQNRPDTPRAKKEEESPSLKKEEEGAEYQSHDIQALTEEIRALREENTRLDVA